MHGGWTSHALRRAVARAWLIRLRTGVYAEPLPSIGVRHLDDVARLQRAAAAVALTNPRVPITHGAAACLLDLPLARVPDRVCVTVERGRMGNIDGTHLHRARMPPGHLARLGRLLIAQTERIVVDVGRELGSESAIAAVDAALRRNWTTPTRLAAVVSECKGWPGSQAATRAIALADPRAESALESISRLRIADAGLPLPEPQVDILASNGRFLARVDFYWDEFGVVGEADGLLKYRDDDYALSREKIRQGLVEDTGLIVARWGWADTRNFTPVIARLENAFARGMRPDRAPRGWRPRPSQPWYPVSAAS